MLSGNPAVEVKGAVSEIALKGGASAQWIFVPMKAGKYALLCSVKGEAFHQMDPCLQALVGGWMEGEPEDAEDARG